MFFLRVGPWQSAPISSGRAVDTSHRSKDVSQQYMVSETPNIRTMWLQGALTLSTAANPKEQGVEDV